MAVSSAGYNKSVVVFPKCTGSWLCTRSWALVYSSYLGGKGKDEGRSIAVHDSADVYVTGWTYSTDFPTVDPIQNLDLPGSRGLASAHQWRVTADLNERTTIEIRWWCTKGGDLPSWTLQSGGRIIWKESTTNGLIWKPDNQQLGTGISMKIEHRSLKPIEFGGPKFAITVPNERAVRLWPGCCACGPEHIMATRPVVKGDTPPPRSSQ